VIIGGKIQHDCPTSRAIGYFLEPLIALAPFSKLPFEITMMGITNNNLDISVSKFPHPVSFLFRYFFFVFSELCLI